MKSWLKYPGIIVLMSFFGPFSNKITNIFWITNETISGLYILHVDILFIATDEVIEDVIVFFVEHVSKINSKKEIACLGYLNFLSSESPS